ncbi:MAG: site-specific integrase [Peptostreptococcaceae bacterium]|nr:site-specific integrase [Peptostreptococcaceae bacterium]
MNSSLVYEKENPYEALALIDGLKQIGRPTLSEDCIKSLQRILSRFSSNKLMDAEWSLSIASSGRRATLRFPMGVKINESIILRALVLENLCYSASTTSSKRMLHDAAVFFTFLEEHNIHIENCRSSLINIYITKLDSIPDLSISQKNSLMRTVAALIATCSKYELLQGIGVIDCSYRWKEQKEPKRSPDSCVTEALDVLFFDITNIDIPNAYRCLYFLLRLIPNRISEVLTMDIDCLSYPDVDVYAVSIPTSKETPYHVPKYQKYNRKLSGWCEGMMYESIRTHQAFALERQSALTNYDKDYLFISPINNRLITEAEFNVFLKSLCIRYNILDASGNQAHVTSHNFRHVAIGERLRNNIISTILTMIESNHSTPEQTMAYGYQSIKDEATHLGAITDEIFQKSWGVSSSDNKVIEPIVFPEYKYKSMADQPFTRLIPGYGICCNVSCSPRFEKCFSCRKFQPDKMYLEYIENAIRILEKKITTLQKKRGSADAIKFNQERLEVFRLYVSKINNSCMHAFA